MHSRWRKGQSGNPRGRSKGAKGLKTIMRDIMTERIPTRVGGREVMMMRIEALTMRGAEIAAKGNGRVLALMLQLYASAVPDQADQQPTSASQQPAELTATDKAILEQLRRELITAADQNPKDSK